MLIVASEPTCVPSEAISVMVQVTETSKVISEAVLEMREEAGFCCTRVSMELIFVTTSAQVVVRDETPVLTFPGQQRMQSSARLGLGQALSRPMSLDANRYTSLRIYSNKHSFVCVYLDN